jgi:4-hydroxy-tetrahydrodipicolinate synthase
VGGLERRIEHLLAGGVAGLFILGTTGEGPSLSYRLRRELIERTCQLVRGRLPVLVGITDTSFIESIELARFAATSGAQAVVAATPYYLPPSQPELLEYLEHLVRALPLPLFLYNMPTLRKSASRPRPSSARSIFEGVIGPGDSSGDGGISSASSNSLGAARIGPC